MAKRRLYVVGVLAVAAVLVPGLLQGGEIQLGGQGGTGTPPGPGDSCDETNSDGCTVEVDWNPHVTCVNESPELGVPYTDLDSLLECMLNEQERVASSFSSELLPGEENGPWGVLIQRLLAYPGFEGWQFPVEIQRLSVYENDPGIRTTQVTVNRTDLVARILEITEGPDTVGGAPIVIELDEDIHEFEDKLDPPQQPDTLKWVGVFDTTGKTALDLNVEIFVWLQGVCRFDVQWDSGYFVISREGGFKRLQFRAENAGVISSDIGLLPKWDPKVAHLFEFGL